MSIKDLLKKINYKVIVICYCSILCVLLICTSLLYNNAETNTAEPSIDFSEGWTVYADNINEQTDAVLPYAYETKGISDIEIHNTIPHTSFAIPMLETVIFQKDFQIYVDGRLIEEKKFEQKAFNQCSPGSGRIFVKLPRNSGGKEIVIKFHKLVMADQSPIAKISIINGIMSDSTIISLSGPMFIATLLMFFVGVCLFITSLVYIFSGIKIYSLCAMSMFVVTASLWIMCNSKVLQYFTSNWVLMHNLEYLSFFSTPLWLWIFLSYHWEGHKKLCKVAIITMSAFFTTALTAKAFGLCDFYAFLKPFHILAVGNIILFLYFGIKGYHKQSTALKVFFLGICCLCFTSFIDLIRYYTIFSPDAMAFFFIFGIIFMGLCLFLTFIMMSKEKFTNIVGDNIYKELAFSDILTGLHSRAKWENDITEIQDNIENYSSVITAMIDVNDLKKVNDNLGHHSGDQLLVYVANALKNRFGSIGNVYRLGGDEFCVILLNKMEAEMKLILSLVDLDLQTLDLPFKVSAAWGYAIYNKTLHKDINDILRDADNAMYESKRLIKEHKDCES